MSKKFIIKGTALEIYDTIALKNDFVVPLRKVWYNERILQAGAIDLINVDISGSENKTVTPIMLGDSLDPNDVVFTEASFRIFAETYFSKSRPIDVVIQDSTSPKIIANFSNIAQQTTMSVSAGDISTFINAIEVDDPTGFVVGQYLSIFNVAANRFYLGHVTNVAASVISLDTPLDFSYPSGSFVTVGSHNMNVNGSVTPQIFGLRNTDEAIGSSYDISRLMFYGLTDTLGNLAEFGDIVALTKGIIIRKVDGEYRNFANFKSNGEMKNTMFDFDLVPSTGSAKDGFVGKFTISKLGSVARIKPGEDLQIIIQDDLTGLVNFSIQAQGSEVVD